MVYVGRDRHRPLAFALSLDHNSFILNNLLSNLNLCGAIILLITIVVNLTIESSFDKLLFVVNS